MRCGRQAALNILSPSPGADEMMSSQQGRLIVEIIDRMADQAVAKGGGANHAIELFSAGVDRLLTWLPAELRRTALLRAESHSYCTPDEIARIRSEDLDPSRH